MSPPKSADAGFITSVIVVLWLTVPATPVRVSVYVPGVVEAAVEMESSVAPLPNGTVTGWNEAVTPLGRPLTVSDTSRVQPNRGTT